jgi:hypothetical protein
MFKKFLTIYKIPLLISITLIIVLTAIKLPRDPMAFTLIIMGSLLGTFLLDLDYIIHAYFLEPATDFSRTLRAFIKHGDLGNAFSFIQYHRGEIKEKVLNSVLFQIVLTGLVIYVVYASPSVFIRALILSVYLNSLYRLAEHILTDRIEDWFWSLKSTPPRDKAILYGFVLFGVFVFCLTLF